MSERHLCLFTIYLDELHAVLMGHKRLVNIPIVAVLIGSGMPDKGGFEMNGRGIEALLKYEHPSFRMCEAGAYIYREQAIVVDVL